MLPKTVTEFKKLINKQARDNKIPLTGQFELTARCNLHCKMCYVCKPAKDKTTIANELSKEQWISLAKEARDAGMLYVLLTGGEVFLRTDFQEIYEQLINMGFRLNIYTNATLITDSIARWLGGITPNSMSVTLYGASPETYRKVTGNSDAFNKAIKGIDLLLEQNIDLEIRTTVIKDNVSDFDALLKICDSRSIPLRYGFYISPRRGICSGMDESIRLSPYDIAEYEYKASMAYLSTITRLKGNPNVEEMNIDNDNHNKKVTVSTHPFKCDAGRSEFWVTWDGKMTPCSIMSEPITEPLLTGFRAAWDELVLQCESIPQCTECNECSLREICWTCPARLKNETGAYDIPAEYLCKWAVFRQKHSS